MLYPKIHPTTRKAKAPGLDTCDIDLGSGGVVFVFQCLLFVWFYLCFCFCDGVLIRIEDEKMICDPPASTSVQLG